MDFLVIAAKTYVSFLRRTGRIAADLAEIVTDVLESRMEMSDRSVMMERGDVNEIG